MRNSFDVNTSNIPLVSVDRWLAAVRRPYERVLLNTEVISGEPHAFTTTVHKESFT